MADVSVCYSGENENGTPMLSLMIGDHTLMRGMFVSIPRKYAKEIGEALVLYSQSNAKDNATAQAAEKGKP